MINAPALPAAPGAMPAGFAAFLANIGQGAPNGDAVDFDQLLAAAPVSLLAAATDTPAAAGAPAATTISTDGEPAAETDAAECSTDRQTAVHCAEQHAPEATGDAGVDAPAAAAVHSGEQQAARDSRNSAGAEAARDTSAVATAGVAVHAAKQQAARDSRNSTDTEAASAGATFKTALNVGKFQGTTAATTPRGTRRCNRLR